MTAGPVVRHPEGGPALVTRRPMAGALGFSVACAMAIAGCGGAAGVHGAASAHDGAGAVVTAGVTEPATTLRLGPVGRTIPAGFLGFSMEFQAVRAYTGDDARQVNPVLVALIRGLTPGQRPVLRIGGDSTDASWAPAAGVAPPRFAGYRYPLTRGWFATTAALARALDARLILGLNLAADEPALDVAEARDDVRAFGVDAIEGFEIGNEPNLFGAIAEQKLADGQAVTARSRGYGPASYARELAATVAALRAAGVSQPLAGPAYSAAEDPPPSGRWIRPMGALLAAEPALRTVTIHRYPLEQCYRAPPHSPQAPTIANLLAPYASEGLAYGVRWWVALARSHGDQLRVDELNSVACKGSAGVSNTFASALWATDTLFSLASAGVAGVNIHTLPGAHYAPFSFSQIDGRWRAAVAPEYYGLKLFAQAAPAGARLVPVQGAGHTRSLSAWATRAPNGVVRVVLIDRDSGHGRVVRIAQPAGSSGPATVERLRAGTVTATGGVALGGQSFGAGTTTGALRSPRTTIAAHTRAGDTSVTVPGGSAVLVTFRG